jgi:hypothetical protein
MTPLFNGTANTNVTESVIVLLCLCNITTMFFCLLHDNGPLELISAHAGAGRITPIQSAGPSLPLFGENGIYRVYDVR